MSIAPRNVVITNFLLKLFRNFNLPFLELYFDVEHINDLQLTLYHHKDLKLGVEVGPCYCTLRENNSTDSGSPFSHLFLILTKPYIC